MNVEVVPLMEFDHDDMKFRANEPRDIDASLAGELERRGLVRIRAIPVARRVDQALTQRPGAVTLARKVPAAGAEESSSASPVGQVSPRTTSSSFAVGGRNIRRRGT